LPLSQTQLVPLHRGTCAAIEYAVTALKVPLLMILGHAQCGGAAHALSICAKVWLHLLGRWCSCPWLLSSQPFFHKLCQGAGP
jgi:hypothetical protein